MDWIRFEDLMHTVNYILRILANPFESVLSKPVDALCRSSTPPPRFMNRGMEGHAEQMGRGRAPGYQGTHMMQDNRSEREERRGEVDEIGIWSDVVENIISWKPHCTTCSYLLPLYRKRPQSVPVGPPWSSFSYFNWELSWWDSHLSVTSLGGLIPPGHSTDGL